MQIENRIEDCRTEKSRQLSQGKLECVYVEESGQQRKGDTPGANAVMIGRFANFSILACACLYARVNFSPQRSGCQRGLSIVDCTFLHA